MGSGESAANNAACTREVEDLTVEFECRPDGGERDYDGGKSGCCGGGGVAIGIFFVE